MLTKECKNRTMKQWFSQSNRAYDLLIYNRGDTAVWREKDGHLNTGCWVKKLAINENKL